MKSSSTDHFHQLLAERTRTFLESEIHCSISDPVLKHLLLFHFDSFKKGYANFRANPSRDSKDAILHIVMIASLEMETKEARTADKNGR